MRQVINIQTAFKNAHQSDRLGEIDAVLLIGSCSIGEATFRSDIDLLVVLRNGPLHYGRVKEIRDRIEEAVLSEFLLKPLPIQLTVVLRSVFDTTEPAMLKALQLSQTLFECSDSGDIACRLEGLRK